MLFLLLSIALVCVAARQTILRWVSNLRQPVRRRPTVFSDIPSISILLHPPFTSLSSLLNARAAANARFVRAFAINSTFTSPSTDTHNEFVKSMKDLISMVDLSMISDVTSYAVDSYVPPDASRPFAEVVRATVLHVVLVSLLQVDAEHLEFDDMNRITVQLNELWTRSKSLDSIPPHLLREINDKLRCWAPHVRSPLEVIIPTYETMWRVVAVTVALVHRDPSLMNVFANFRENPTFSQLRCQDAESIPSAKAVVLEVLRLYPPTRRISRSISPVNYPSSSPSRLLEALRATLPFRFSPEPRETLVADVEAAQSDPAVWGPDADVFDPRRWENIPESEWGSRLLSFGLGPLKCVASAWAPGAAVAIAASVLGSVEVLEGAGEVTSSRDGWEGWRVVRYERCTSMLRHMASLAPDS